MNLGVLSRLLGVISLLIGLAMAFPLAWSAYYCFYIPESTESDFLPILASMVFAAAVGGVLVAAGRRRKGEIQRREGLAVVGLGWVLAGALGAVPFYLSGVTPSIVDAYFESVSGFTTTGSTILRDIEAAPHGILMWRSFTQWLGGMGIVVLFVAFLPFLRAGGKQLMFNEVPGPRAETLSPRIQDTAMLLWKFYVIFSLILVILLAVQGMPLFEAVCHACTTMSTGGFSPRADSIGAYDSAFIEVTIIIFMIIAGTNFGLYYRTIRGDWSTIFRDAEWRFFLLILLVAGGLIFTDLILENGTENAAGALRGAAFQAVSITTTTGFGTADFDEWPSLSRAVLVVLFFVGGCAGSTAGGIKVIRILVIIKNAVLATEQTIRPSTVRLLRVGKTIVEPDIVRIILAYFTIIMGTMVIGTLALTALDMDPISAMSAAATTLNNIGPGLGTVGASEPFSDVPATGKVLLSLFMIVGRLEVFAIVVLFSPRLWSSH